MITVITDFNTRVEEIDKYYKLLNTFINEEVKLYYPSKRTHKIRSVDEDLIKVMKAHCFLLVYNLMESSIKSSITAIYDAITTSNIKYEDVIDEIQKLWLTENYKNFKNKGTDFIYNTINTIKNDVIDINFNADKVISGNIDAQKIRELSDLLGFSKTTHHRANNGVSLHQVKMQRNNLAHGSISFSQCGRQYTYEELEIIKKEVVIYLRSILNNIKKYIDENVYAT